MCICIHASDRPDHQAVIYGDFGASLFVRADCVLQSNRKRQQPSYAVGPEPGTATLSKTAAAVLDTAAQLASPRAAASDGPDAQNLRAALGTAVAEEHASNIAGYACAELSALPADLTVPDLVQLAAADPSSNGSGSAPRDDLKGSQEVEGQESYAAALPGTMLSDTGHSASPVFAQTAKNSCQEGPESKGGMNFSSPGHSGPPGAQSKPLSGVAHSPSGHSSGQLKGIPGPSGSHLHFDSDAEEATPSAASELEDSEVIAQLHFDADERGHMVISFNGRSMAEIPQDKDERAQSGTQAGTGRQEQSPAKYQRQW